MKEETRELLEKAERAMRATRTLLDAEDAEFAAGRAYYAMFYVAEALLHEGGLRFRKHQGVHGAFGREFEHGSFGHSTHPSRHKIPQPGPPRPPPTRCAVGQSDTACTSTDPGASPSSGAPSPSPSGVRLRDGLGEI